MIKQMGVLALASLGITLSAHANESLAKNKACLACHQIERKVVGPAFKDIAKQYKGKKNATADLAKKIKTGGKGVWGPVPMPAQNVTEEEASQLATWILTM